MCQNEGRLAEADDLYRQAIRIYENGKGQYKASYADALKNYAVLLKRKQRPDEAEQLEAKARGLLERVAAEPPHTRMVEAE